MKNFIHCCGFLTVLGIGFSVLAADLETEFINSSTAFSQVATAVLMGLRLFMFPDK